MKMAWVIAAAFLIASAWAQGPATCGWLSPQQVKAVLGAGAAGHERSPRTGQENGVRVTYGGCDWEIQGSSDQIGKALILTWAHLDSTRGSSTKDLIQQIVKAEQAQTNVKFTLTPLSGFGDEAYTLLLSSSRLEQDLHLQKQIGWKHQQLYHPRGELQR
ncbi:MAG TPA: hypothetical protein VFS50_12260 [Meiothermus sp.]|nr:hypothetical protein [Meiothermus sp.]